LPAVDEAIESLLIDEASVRVKQDRHVIHGERVDPAESKKELKGCCDAGRAKT